MSNPTHASLVQRQKSEITDWILANPSVALDFSGMRLVGYDFSGLSLKGGNFSGCQLSEANFEAADLSGALLHNASLSSATFAGTDLTGANCADASFENSEFSNAKIYDANFNRARLVNAKSFPIEQMRQASFLGAHISLKMENADLSNMRLDNVTFEHCELAHANFSGSVLHKSKFTGCDTTDASFEKCDCTNAEFRYSNLTRASFLCASLKGADLRDANLSHAEISGADFYEALVSNANFDKVKGAVNAKNLHLVRFDPAASDARYFESALVPFYEHYISWERIRFLGRLPLFGASYATLIAIPFLYYFLDLYNRQISLIQKWASEETSRTGPYATLANQVALHLHKEPIPELSLLLLVSTILLGIGATLFAFGCPARVREFSRDQWRDELGHSLMTYMPLSWRHPPLRFTCVALYILGVAGVLIVLSSKLLNVFNFIIENS